MAKHVVLAVVGLLYVAGAVWLVHTQGDTYRHSLHERREARLASLARKEEKAQPVPIPPVASIPEPKPSIAEPPHEPRKVREPRKSPKPRVAPPSPVATRSHPEPAPKSFEAPIRLKPLVLAGLETASTAEQAMFGETLNKLILINHPAVEEGGAELRTVLDAVQPMLELRARQDVEIKVTVLDSNAVNAFSHIGGYLYVTRGLLNFAGTEEEYQFVIGHELAHIDLKHGQELVARLTQDGTIEKLGTMQALYRQIGEGYTEAQEFAADDWVIERMLKLDHTTRECLMFLRKLRRLSEEQNFREGHKSSKATPEAPIQDVDNHLRSAPAAWKRLARLETRLNATPARPGAVGPAGTGR